MIIVRCPRAAVLAGLLLTAAWLIPASAEAGASRHHGKRTAWFEALWRTASSHPVLGTSRLANWIPSNDVDDDFDDRDTRTDPTSRVVIDDDSALSDAAPARCIRVSRDVDPVAAHLIVWRKLAAPRPPPSL